MGDKVFFVGPWERVLYLRTVPALRGLASAELVRVAQFARERHFPKGAFLLEKGKRAEAFHVVVEGLVRVRRPWGDQTIGPRDVVGFLHLLARTEGGLEARADSEVLTLEFDADVQMDLCEEHFSILLTYARFLSRSLLQASDAPPPWAPAPVVRPVAPRQGPELVERILALYRSEAFCNCSLDALAELARHLSEVQFPGGGTVWKAGERSDWFLLMESGAVGVPLEAPLGAGQVTGLEEALAGWPRRREVLALEDSLALRVEIEPFLDILEDHFEMAMALLSSMASRLLALQELRAASAAPR